MAVTPEVVRTNGGMPKWTVMGMTFADRKLQFFWPYTSEIGGERFLTRFILIFTRWGGCHITRIHMADDLREWPHDHSATFWSWVFGWYEEVVYDDPDNLNRVRHVRHRRFSIHRLRHSQAHSITAVSPRLFTILFLGRRRRKSNYWTPDGPSSLGMKMDQN